MPESDKKGATAKLELGNDKCPWRRGEFCIEDIAHVKPCCFSWSYDCRWLLENGITGKEKS